jgi:hypothetical protein
MSQFSPESITALIDDYGLNTETVQIERIVAAWLEQYEAAWIVKAIVEAVFRGRYQLKSVDDILKQWQRLGKPRCSFKPDFERERLKKFSPNPDSSDVKTDGHAHPPKRLNHQLPVTPSPLPRHHCALNPEELEPFLFNHRRGEIFPSSDLQPAANGAAIEPPVIDPQIYPPNDPPHGVNTNSGVRHPPPPRWWLLDKLKIAISGTERGQTKPSATEISSAHVQSTIDENSCGRQPQPDRNPNIPNTSRQF